MPGRTSPSRLARVAVIDIGSNSGRVVVFERDGSNHLRLLAGSRASLRLVHDVDERAALSEATMSHTMEALRDFRAIATGAGATHIVAVATAAMRDAGNGALFVERVRRELGIRIRIIGGLPEARYGFAGAVRGLAVSDGLLFDLGGGSIQISRFSHRRLIESVSLPLGALRLSEKFLESDPPTGRQIRRLRDHVRSHLASTRLARLRAGFRIVGTGGTVRNLAKIDRQTRQYPIDWLHGYDLSVDRLAEVVGRLAAKKEKRRDEIPGLSAERADSIVGGGLVIQTLAEVVRAKHILVSGQGLREGVALALLKLPPAPADIVREASIASLISRFTGWRREAASQRRAIAVALCRGLVPKTAPGVAAAIDHAARVLDIGRSIDVVNRHEHVSDILLRSELNGFAHDELMLVAAIVRRAGDRHAEVSPLTLDSRPIEIDELDRAAIILALADEIEARCPIGRRIEMRCEVGRRVTLSVPLLRSWLAKDLDKRFERAFGRPLFVRHPT
jgi:exopolyphosphatase / guanosine-5'-triphosphate,3'-diphosphate pyrophosphatase